MTPECLFWGRQTSRGSLTRQSSGGELSSKAGAGEAKSASPWTLRSSRRSTENTKCTQLTPGQIRETHLHPAPRCAGPTEDVRAQRGDDTSRPERRGLYRAGRADRWVSQGFSVEHDALMPRLDWVVLTVQDTRGATSP